jgi:hypothetical protein
VAVCLSGCSRGHCCRRAMSRAFHLWMGSGKKLHRVGRERETACRAEYGRSVEGDQSSTIVCLKAWCSVCISASINPRVVHASSAQRAAARIGSIHVTCTLIFNQPSINRPSNSTSTVNQFLCYFDDTHGMPCMHVIQYIARATTSDPSHEPPTCCHCLLSAYKRLPRYYCHATGHHPRPARLQ